MSECKFEVGDYIDVVINAPDVVGNAIGRGNGAAGGPYGVGPRRSGGDRAERDRGGRYGR